MKLAPRRIISVALAAIALACMGYWMIACRDQPVATIVVERAQADRILALNGRIRPRLQIDIRPTLGGTLVALPFDVGDRVAREQILARIDDAPEQAAIAQAQASAETQQATLAQARRELARFEALGQFATRRDIEQLRLAVLEGERELNRRQAAIVQASELRDRRVLRAPFAGIILERPVDPGQTVGPESVIYRLADLSNPEISIEVDEVYAAEIRIGMTATVALPGQQRLLRARVHHVEPRVDPATGARAVRLDLINPAIDAPSGLTVTVNLLIERRQGAISIPRGAMILSGRLAKVRVVGDDNVVSERLITFVDWPAEFVIVTSGLQSGERILMEPVAVQPGESVRVNR
jgi:RND family efflux transporter MFP subunit